MIEETAIVRSAEAGLVEVEVERRTTCGGCSAQAACGVSLLDRLLGRRAQRLIVANTLRAGPGETVIIGVPEAALLRAALAAYLWPLLGLLGGALLGQMLGPDLSFARVSPAVFALASAPAGAPSGLLAELPPLLGGAVGFAAGLFLLRGYSRRLAADPTYHAVLLRRVSLIGIAPPGALPDHQPDGQVHAQPRPRLAARPAGSRQGVPVKPPAQRG